MAASSQTTDFHENYVPTDFNKIKVGAQTLKDATLEEIGSFKKVDPRLRR